MTRKTKIKFVIFCNQIIGELRPDWTVEDCMTNMTKRQKEFWSTIEWRDEDGNRMVITREFIEEQGMTIEECIEDWKTHMADQFEESIWALKGITSIHL